MGTPQPSAFMHVPFEWWASDLTKAHVFLFLFTWLLFVVVDENFIHQYLTLCPSNTLHIPSKIHDLF